MTSEKDRDCLVDVYPHAHTRPMGLCDYPVSSFYYGDSGGKPRFRLPINVVAMLPSCEFVRRIKLYRHAVHFDHIAGMISENV